MKTNFNIYIENFLSDGFYVSGSDVKTRYGTEKFGDIVELIMGKGKTKTPYVKSIDGHPVYSSYVINQTSDIIKELLLTLKGKSKNLNISEEDLNAFIKRTAIHLYATVPNIEKVDLVVTTKSSSDLAKRLAKEIASKSSDHTLLFAPDSIIKGKINNIKISDEIPHEDMRKMLVSIIDKAKTKQSFEMKKVPGRLRKFIYDFLELDPELVKKVEGKNVLLVDDYLITGSTLQEAFRMIDFLNPASMQAVCFFKLSK